MSTTESNNGGSLQRMVRPMVSIIRICETMVFILPVVAVEIIRWEHIDLPPRRPDGETTRWILELACGWLKWHWNIRIYGPVSNRPNAELCRRDEPPVTLKSKQG